MSIAEKVATQFNAQDASYIGLDGKLSLFRDIVSDAGGVFLRATTPDDEINSIYTNPQGWVFGFSDGSRIAIACGSEPVVLENEGVDYPKEKAQEEERQQKAWLESLPETAQVIYSDGKPFVAKGRAWWISHALELSDGRVSVARIHAEDKDDRSIMLELTEDMLKEYEIVPGDLQFPTVVDGERPKTNRTDSPTSQKVYQKLIDDLQNENGIHSPE